VLYHSPNPEREDGPQIVFRVEVDGFGRMDTTPPAGYEPALRVHPPGTDDAITVLWRKIAVGEVAGAVPPSPAGFKLYGLGRFHGTHYATAYSHDVVTELGPRPVFLTGYEVTFDTAADALNRLLVFGWQFDPIPPGCDGMAERARDPKEGDDIRPLSGRTIRAACERPFTGGE
jgi:hypothetical protein